MAEENKDEELEKTVEQKEAPVSLEIKPEKIETLDETLKKGESGKEEIISKAVKEIGDEKKALKIHGANSAQIGEFNKGGKKVEKGVINAEGDFKEEIKIVKGDTAEKEAGGHCSSCGKETAAGDKFCTHCGNKLAVSEKDSSDKFDEKEEEKKPNEIIKEVEAEISFLDISTLSPDEQLKSVDNQLNFLAPLLKNIKDYDNYSEARELKRQLENMKKRLELKTGKKEGEVIVSGFSKEINKTSEELFKESEDKFMDAFQELGAYNQTVPNWFKEQSENLGKIIDELKRRNVDKETINFLEKAVIEDRKNMINIMCRKENIDIYYANPGKDEGKHEEINIIKYVEHIENRDIEMDKIEGQLDKIDKEITKAIGEFQIELFADDWSIAASFLEKAKNLKNIKEQQANLLMAMHIMESIEKGMKDAGIERALKNNLFNY